MLPYVKDILTEFLIPHGVPWLDRTHSRKHHLANYELKPEITADGSYRWMAYAPLEYLL
jgi:hypothetical protein